MVVSTRRSPTRRSGFSKRVYDTELRVLESLSPPLTQAAYEYLNTAIIRDVIAPMQRVYEQDKSSSAESIAAAAFWGAPRAHDDAIGAGTEATRPRSYLFGLLRGGLPRPESMRWNPFAVSAFREVFYFFRGASTQVLYYLTSVLHKFVKAILRDILDAPPLDSDLRRKVPFPSVAAKISVARQKKQGGWIKWATTTVPPISLKNVYRGMRATKSGQDVFTGVFGNKGNLPDPEAANYKAQQYAYNKRVRYGGAPKQKRATPPAASAAASSSSAKTSAKKGCTCPCACSPSPRPPSPGSPQRSVRSGRTPRG